MASSLVLLISSGIWLDLTPVLFLLYRCTVSLLIISLEFWPCNYFVPMGNTWGVNEPHALPFYGQKFIPLMSHHFPYYSSFGNSFFLIVIIVIMATGNHVVCAIKSAVCVSLVHLLTPAAFYLSRFCASWFILNVEFILYTYRRISVLEMHILLHSRWVPFVVLFLYVLRLGFLLLDEFCVSS